MSSIITITFSPCIDKSTSIPALVPEKKLNCTSPRMDPGGGGINVARAIKKLGGEAITIFPSGGYTGNYFNHLLEKENITMAVIKTVQETRENIIVLDEATNNQYRFGMPGTHLLEKEWQQCLEAVSRTEDVGFIVASGSLPPGVPSDIYARIARIAKARHIKLIVDSSGEALRHAVNEGVYLVKPNLGELASLTGKDKLDIAEAEQAAMTILQKTNCEIVVVSMGREGAMLVTAKEIYNARPPEVPRKSTVGAGDSMVAGIVYSIAKGASLKHALEYGVACGTAATMNPGTELCHKKDADNLYARMTA